MEPHHVGVVQREQQGGLAQRGGGDPLLGVLRGAHLLQRDGAAGEGVAALVHRPVRALPELHLLHVALGGVRGAGGEGGAAPGRGGPVALVRSTPKAGGSAPRARFRGRASCVGCGGAVTQVGWTWVWGRRGSW